ncbi:uncharacterized protein BCR38DRAFT_420580 [Pseudomassariella vexata]|uniref:Uncharacterized protein n=1 Tax=Pseudomassariella vexata TaxID=1141098 RepID=A0A1Y2EF80_9PEZI|nr:uncharacterized protein BCR38DRAFT_420580 [Pseudomassariella vexata]ORY69964.1 hypothetical protein BCR38DRAFT_420580 [Pseudomassariella vexata]
MVSPLLFAGRVWESASACCCLLRESSLVDFKPDPEATVKEAHRQKSALCSVFGNGLDASASQQSHVGSLSCW